MIPSVMRLRCRCWPAWLRCLLTGFVGFATWATILAGGANAMYVYGMLHGHYERLVVGGQDVVSSRIGVIASNVHGRFIHFEFATGDEMGVDFRIVEFPRTHTDDDAGVPVDRIELITYAPDGHTTRDGFSATGTCRRRPVDPDRSSRVTCSAESARGHFYAAYVVNGFQAISPSNDYRVPPL